MGWLDHSTNNIILDAVLTDYGRQQLSKVDGKFSITHYALADDEVDYKMIKKYGRAVGKEKIEKNTPIFEALTNPSIAMKYMLIARENTAAIATIFLPYLQASVSSLSLNKDKTTLPITIDLLYRGSNTNIPNNLLQTTYTIKVPDRFFYLSNAGGGSLTTQDLAKSTVTPGDTSRTASYTFTPDQGRVSFSFSVNTQSIDNTMLSVYGKRTGSGNNRAINTEIKVTGNTSGITLNIPVTYTASTT